jgi:peptidoglycan/LPS O-acetylase OafA/YrhL
MTALERARRRAGEIFMLDGGADRLLPMEGLRGVAVALVFLVHYGTMVEPWVPAGTLEAVVGRTLRDTGNAGVDLFFVLSGYLIYGHLLARRPPFLAYMRRRIVRIYPAFLCVLAIYLALFALAPERSRLPDDPGEAALYIAANILLLPGIFPIEPIFTVAWSLSYELAFYLAAPALIAVFALHRRPLGGRIAILVALSLVLSGIVALAGGGPAQMVLFLAGAIVSELGQTRVGARLAPWTIVAFVVGLVVYDRAKGSGLAGLPPTWALALAFPIVCLGAFSGLGRAARWLCWAPLRAFGNMSYSYYLIHGLGLHVFFLAVGRLIPQGPFDGAYALMLLPAFATTLVPSMLLFGAVERPLSLVQGPRRAAT